MSNEEDTGKSYLVPGRVLHPRHEDADNGPELKTALDVVVRVINVILDNHERYC